jgi:hypothetical protein
MMLMTMVMLRMSDGDNDDDDDGDYYDNSKVRSMQGFWLLAVVCCVLVVSVCYLLLCYPGLFLPCPDTRRWCYKAQCAPTTNRCRPRYGLA